MAAAQDTVPVLERLNGLATITMKQLTSTYKGNNFTILTEGNVLFNLVEEKHDFSMFSSGRRRGFNINGVDNSGRKVFSFRRPGVSISDKLELVMSVALVSVVRLKASFLKPVIRINDAQDNLVLRLKGKISDKANFQLQTNTKTTIGSVHKKTHDSVKEILSRLDEYVINFPADLDVHYKIAVNRSLRFHFPGLERLSQLPTIMIHQTSSGYNGNNYTILGDVEDVLLTLNENVPDTIFRGGAHRAFSFDGVENTGRKVCSFLRPRGRFLISNKVELFMNEELVSIVHLEKTFMTPIFSIHDAHDIPTIRLKGKATNTGYFELQTNTRTVIGGLQKKSRSWGDTMFSFRDDYIMSFPADLAVRFKLAVIVACVFIDFRFHEGK